MTAAAHGLSLRKSNRKQMPVYLKTPLRPLWIGLLGLPSSAMLSQIGHLPGS